VSQGRLSAITNTQGGQVEIETLSNPSKSKSHMTTSSVQHAFGALKIEATSNQNGDLVPDMLARPAESSRVKPVGNA
jgi:hypothetical protein